MQNALRMPFVVATTLGIVFVMACSLSTPLQIVLNNERQQTMNHGIFNAQDAGGAPIQLIFQEVDVITNELNQLLCNAASLLAQTYVTMELQFVRTYPDAVETEMFLKPLAPLFKDGIENVDWHQAEKELYTNLVHFFATTDFAKYVSARERQWFVIAKDVRTGTTLGIIQFLVMQEFEPGTVKVAMFGVESGAQGRGIDMLLASSIYKLIPVKRLFLHTRITNEGALGMYREWGFTPYQGPLPYWQDMEYVSSRSLILQKAARGFKE